MKVASEMTVIRFLWIISMVLYGGGCSDAGGEDEEVSIGSTPEVTQRSATSPVDFRRGDVFVQKVSLKEGAEFKATITPSTAGLGLADSDDTGDTTSKDVSLEIILADAEGVEVEYDRGSEEEGVITYSPEQDGDYTVIVKPNDETPTDYPDIVSEGEESSEEMILARESTEATNGGILLKGVVVLARNCVELDSSANTTTVQAPSGEYFVQPIIFLGKVNSDGDVSEISDATITISSGASTIALKSLSSMERKLYRDIYASNSSLSDEEERSLTRVFYQGYFGAAGELYSVDSFRKGGSCADAGTVALSGDIGSIEMLLQVVDDTENISRTISLRPTVSSAFSLYESTNNKLSDWTQCTYDRITANPITYNGDATVCKSFSISDPPYITLDYQLPSASSAELTVASDPTRLISYGHSYAKDFLLALINQSAELQAATSPKVSLDRCLNSGGVISVPLDVESKSYLPLAEFNVGTGDVISLARATGVHTVLEDFFQGNLTLNQTVKIAACIPDSASSCAAYRLIDVAITNCEVKADSGIMTTSIGNSYIYPDYFEMSGTIVE